MRAPLTPYPPNAATINTAAGFKCSRRDATEQSIQIADEIALARKALVIIIVSLVGATLIDKFAGPL